MQREAISKRVRFEIFKRDSFTCQYCGKQPPSASLQIDHIIPVSAGGDNDLCNLITACHDCNAGKAHLPSPNPKHDHSQSDEERARKLLEYKAIAAKAVAEKERIQQLFYKVSDYWMLLSDEPAGEYELCGDIEVSIKRFLKSLPLKEVLKAVYVTFKRAPDYKRIRYFCGICWNKINDAKLEQEFEQSYSLSQPVTASKNINRDANEKSRVHGVTAFLEGTCAGTLNIEPKNACA